MASIRLVAAGALFAFGGCSHVYEDSDEIPEVERPLRVMLHGGGPEDDALFGRFVTEGALGGHVVTLGANSANDPYLLWWDDYFVSLGAESATTVNTTSRDDASDPAAVEALEQADAVFIRGGDQAKYLKYWSDTPLYDALLSAWDRGVAIGGSSAGCAILGERAYDAREGSIDSWEAMLDPWDPEITFTDGFLPTLPGVLTDTHFTERGRLLRLSVFLERWKLDGGPGLGIGVDPETALFIAPDGTGEVEGEGAVTVLDARASSADLSAPPDIRDQIAWVLPAGYSLRFDFAPGETPVVERPSWVSVGDESGSSDIFEELTLDGSSSAGRAAGEWTVTGLDDPNAFRDRTLALVPGDDLLPGAVVVTRLYDDSDLFESHVAGLLWALSQAPGAIGIGLDLDMTASAAPPRTIEADPGSWVLVVDGRTVTARGAPDAGWQSAALEGLTLDVVGSDGMWEP